MRLIDGDALSEKFIKECAEECAICPMCDGRQYNNPKLLHCKIIIDAPIIDRPQGEWEIEYRGNGWNDYWDYICSNCGKKYERADAVLYKANFCPNCGAKMKGAEDD